MKRIYIVKLVIETLKLKIIFKNLNLPQSSDILHLERLSGIKNFTQIKNLNTST